MSTLKANTISSISGTHCDFTNQKRCESKNRYNDNTPAENFNDSVTDVAADKVTPNWTNNLF